MQPKFRLSIVDFTLEANELSVELARCANNCNDLGLDWSKIARGSTPVKTIETVDVFASAEFTVLYDSLPTEKDHGRNPM
jgi:hypothetical protein